MSVSGPAPNPKSLSIRICAESTYGQSDWRYGGVQSVWKEHDQMNDAPSEHAPIGSGRAGSLAHNSLPFRGSSLSISLVSILAWPLFVCRSYLTSSGAALSSLPATLPRRAQRTAARMPPRLRYQTKATGRSTIGIIITSATINCHSICTHLLTSSPGIKIT